MLRWELAGRSYFLALHRFSLHRVTESEPIPVSWIQWVNLPLDTCASLICSLSGHGFVCDQWHWRTWCWMHSLGLFVSPPLLGQDCLRSIFSPLSNLMANCSNSGASPTCFRRIFHSLIRFQDLEVDSVTQPKLSSTWECAFSPYTLFTMLNNSSSSQCLQSTRFPSSFQEEVSNQYL